MNNGNCSQICRNEPGSYHCECAHGYALADDRRNCVGKLLFYDLLSHWHAYTVCPGSRSSLFMYYRLF